MGYDVDKAPGGMICIPSFIKIGAAVQAVLRLTAEI
jgi:hypothetical protein